MKRAISFYDSGSGWERDIIIAFGGFSPEKYEKVREAYQQLTRQTTIRIFLSNRTYGLSLDPTIVTYSVGTGGKVCLESPSYREEWGPEGEEAQAEVLWLLNESNLYNWLSDKPLYRTAMKDRLGEVVLRRHGGYPLGIATAWNYQAGIWIVQALQKAGILEPAEVERAHTRNRPKFFPDANLTDLLVA